MSLWNNSPKDDRIATTITTGNPLVVKKSFTDIPSSSSSSSDNDDKAIVKFVYPPTNTTVIVIGCLHGSSSSAADVERILYQQEEEEEEMTMIVLELCASRFANIRRELANQEASSVQQQYKEKEESPRDKWNNFWSMVSTTSEKKGISTGIAAALLGGAAALQSLSNNKSEPGSEFITAMNYAKQHPTTCDIILADRNVDETLRRVGIFPSISWQIFQQQNNNNNNNNDDPTIYHQLSQQLTTAIWGSSNNNNNKNNNKHTMEIPQIDMGQALVRNENAIQDLIRLTLPPLIIAEGVAFLVQSFIALIITTTAFTTTTTNMATSSSSYSILWDMGTSIGVLGLAYIFIALPAAKLVLFERDEQLAKGIQIACQIAATNNNNNNNKSRVVAVVGLLHVNGIVNRLLL